MALTTVLRTNVLHCDTIVQFCVFRCFICMILLPSGVINDDDDDDDIEAGLEKYDRSRYWLRHFSVYTFSIALRHIYVSQALLAVNRFF